MSDVFKIEIIETLSRTVSIEAEDESDALNKVKQSYSDEQIVITSDNYITTEFLVSNTDKDSSCS